jgi:hypothetical protein
MKKFVKVLSPALAVILPLFLISPAGANLMANGDFSLGTLAGWTASGNVSATDYGNMPAAYKSTWDLSSWKNAMDGTFALIETTGDLNSKIASAPGSASFSISFDYAVAWEKTQFAPSNSYGYFALEVRGVTDAGPSYGLSYSEKSWGPLFGFEKGVLTDSFYQTVIEPPGLKGIEVSFFVANPNQTLNQIVGIDNVSLAPAPVPEPSTMLLLGLGLAGLVGRGLKSKNAPKRFSISRFGR